MGRVLALLIAVLVLGVADGGLEEELEHLTSHTGLLEPLTTVLHGLVNDEVVNGLNGIMELGDKRTRVATLEAELNLELAITLVVTSVIRHRQLRALQVHDLTIIVEVNLAGLLKRLELADAELGIHERRRGNNGHLKGWFLL